MQTIVGIDFAPATGLVITLDSGETREFSPKQVTQQQLEQLPMLIGQPLDQDQIQSLLQSEP